MDIYDFLLSYKQFFVKYNWDKNEENYLKDIYIRYPEEIKEKVKILPEKKIRKRKIPLVNKPKKEKIIQP